MLLDLMMPDMDGWDVYQQMKASEATQNIPVIVITAKAQSIDKVLGLHIAKVDDYISKPFSPQELVDSVEKVLARRHEQAEKTRVRCRRGDTGRPVRLRKILLKKVEADEARNRPQPHPPQITAAGCQVLQLRFSAACAD